MSPPAGGGARSSLRLPRGSMMSQGAALCTGGPVLTSVCYLDADAIPTGSDESIVLLGHYDDELVKDAGRWWLKERKIIGYYSHAAGRLSPGRGE